MSNMDYVEFDPKNCPVGEMNELKIQHTEDKLTQMIERLAEKIEETQEDIASLSNNMDAKFDQVDRRFDSMEEKFEKQISDLKKSVPETIDEQLQKKQGNAAFGAIKWLICGAGGTIFITLVGAFLKAKFGL